MLWHCSHDERCGRERETDRDRLRQALNSVMNQDSRSSSPEAPPQDLWSSILNSVSSSRSIPSKNILILGQPSTGKTTLTSALLQKLPADGGKDEPRTDFALGYDWADVRDEGEEGRSFVQLIRYVHPQRDAVRYPCSLIRLYRTIFCSVLYVPCLTFFEPTIRSSSYGYCRRAGLDTTLDLPRRIADLACLDRALGPR
jgi:GTPase SAR1 family protein